MILCDKCENYLWPEPDEDGIWCADCLSPSVISVFMNFFRLRKCKYYKKISYEKMLKRCKFVLRLINHYTWHYRDSKYKYRWKILSRSRIREHFKEYLEFRDYLFKEVV